VFQEGFVQYVGLETTSGEIEEPLMAREQEERKLSRYMGLALALIIAMIGIGGYSIYRLVRITTQAPRFTDIVICDECGYIFKKEHAADEKSPYKCEKCGKRKVYKAFYCVTCGRYFPNLNPLSKEKIECPYCLSTDVKEQLYLPPRKPDTGPDE
jgi:DNA-directed RNA polymerase subunit RPC12/RpoP